MSSFNFWATDILGVGSSIVLNLRDETGYVAQSADITVQSSCKLLPFVLFPFFPKTFYQ